MVTAFLGLPQELWYVIGFVLIIIVYLYYRFQVKSIPERCIYVRENYTGEPFDAKTDLNGQFVKLYKNRKLALVVRKNGTPIEFHEGGAKWVRLHLLVEGHEETLDVINKAEEQEELSGYQSAAIHETLGTWQAWLNLMSSAVKKGLLDTLLPMLAGAGAAVLIIKLIEMFTVKPS